MSAPRLPPSSSPEAPPEFADKRVRMAFDTREQRGIVDKIMKASPPWPPAEPAVRGHNPVLAPARLDKAKALMKEAGYEMGFTVTMIAPTTAT
jgi:peptide/nickel transport system substrate-binding protein